LHSSFNLSSDGSTVISAACSSLNIPE
jgi:hypothetical protein